MKKLGITLAVLMGLLIVLAVATSGDKPATNSLGAKTSEAGKQIGQNVQDAIPTTPQTATSETPAGPLTTVGDGDFEVGVDMAAGKYKTQGPEDEGDSCYYEVHDESGDFKGIKKNGNLSGPGNVTLKKGDYFKSGQGFTKGCVWTKVA